MRFLSSSSRFNTAIILIFFAAWLYTEVTEYIERDEFYVEVTDFMYKGDRFTSEDGQELLHRIEELERNANDRE